MPRIITAPEKTILRTHGQFSKLYLAIAEYQTVYSARLNGAPTSTDMVYQINYDGGAGTLADVRAGMTLYIGTTAGAYDLGMCRIRKTPTATIFYIGETSAIAWADNCHLTVVNDFQLRQKPIRMVSNSPRMDVDIAYTDQHHDFNPVPILGSHIVAKMTGADVTVQAGPTDSTASWVFDSTIASVLWEAPTAISIDDETAVNPQITFDTAGWHILYCTVTAANGKSAMGVRWVYIYSDTAPAVSAFNLKTCEGSTDAGGWSFSVEMFADAASIRDRALVILFGEDFADGEAITSPNAQTGRENIICIGWIAGESISRNSETGTVEFKVEGAQSWLKKIPDFVVGLEFKTGTSSAWTNIQRLNIDRALWHLLYWRSTALTVMDFFPTLDTRYSAEFKTSSPNLWERMNEIAQTSIFAAPGVDRFGRLFLSIEPQMTPIADRDFVEIDTLTSQDIEGDIRWGRSVVEELALLNFSGVSIGADKRARAYFSLSPGHVHTQYGNAEQVERILLSGQTQSNALCGLYFGWRNNPLESFEINLAGSYRFADCVPPQYLNLTIDPADDPRGIGFSGRALPRSITLAHNLETGFLSVSMALEPESFPGISVKGDMILTNGGTPPDLSIPPVSDFPPMPQIPPLYPAPTQPNANHPTTVILHSDNYGVLYTTTFNTDLPEWYFMNDGLLEIEYTYIQNLIITPGGTLYLLTQMQTVWVADGLGGTWRPLFTHLDYPIQDRPTYVLGIGVNPQANDQIAIFGGKPWSVYPSWNWGMTYMTLASRSGFGSFEIAQSCHIYPSTVLFNNGGWSVFHAGIEGMSGEQSASRLLLTDASGAQQSVTAIVNDYRSQSEHYATSIGTSSRVLLWVQHDSYNSYFEWNGTTPVETFGISPHHRQSIAFSPTGNFGMAESGALHIPMRTSDGGATWESAAVTIPVGSSVWENCGDDFRWIFGGSLIRLTLDRGETYIEKSGNLLEIAPLINVMGIRFIA